MQDAPVIRYAFSMLPQILGVSRVRPWLGRGRRRQSPAARSWVSLSSCVSESLPISDKELMMTTTQYRTFSSGLVMFSLNLQRHETVWAKLHSKNTTVPWLKALNKWLWCWSSTVKVKSDIQLLTRFTLSENCFDRFTRISYRFIWRAYSRNNQIGDE